MPREQELPTIGLAELAAIRGGTTPSRVKDPRVAEVLADVHSSLKELTTKASDGSFTRLLPFFGSHER
jgi:hypothetical protein